MCNFYKNMNHFFGSLGVTLVVVSILVLIGSFIFSLFYAMFFAPDDLYVNINIVLSYIAFWGVLLVSGEKMASKAPNSVFKFKDNKKDMSIADE
ncbi:hypothetical protein [Arcobacter vandammei]|uniref:hypothetical protein n=1 Tax=Arcobacter vandammei TaxID=2782243 RepID=UPI0018E036BA|nr:hypothetical protein [Arcobacter vandammei]